MVRSRPKARFDARANTSQLHSIPPLLKLQESARLPALRTQIEGNPPASGLQAWTPSAFRGLQSGSPAVSQLSTVASLLAGFRLPARAQHSRRIEKVLP